MPRPARLGLLRLEDRTCPSEFYNYTVLARTGDSIPVPGQPNPATILSLDSSPAINSRGLAAFAATMSNLNDYVLAWDQSGGLRALPSQSPALTIDVGPVNERDQIIYINNEGLFGGTGIVRAGRVELLNGNTGAAETRAFIPLPPPVPLPGSPPSPPIPYKADFNYLFETPTVNNNGDVAYAARKFDDNTSSGTLYFQGAGSQLNKGVRLADFKVEDGRIYQPSLSDDGLVVGQAGSKPNSPIVLYAADGSATTIAGPGWDVLGARPSISADGRVVVFYGIPGAGNTFLGSGEGIFASVRTGTGRTLVRVAGGADGLAGFDPDGRVSVNSTAETQRAVTVAFTAVGRGAKGVYSSRLNFFGPTAGVGFVTDYPAAVIAAKPTPVVKVGEGG